MAERSIQVRHPLFARMYVRVSRSTERRGAAEHRRQLLAGLAGRVVEVGAGNGMNFRHYPATVSEVLAVEPEPHLRHVAETAALRAPVPIRVVDGIAEHLPAADGVFDAAVISLVLCSVADQQQVLAEAIRVLRPGGQLRFYEHVVARRPGMARMQRLLDAIFWPRVAGGCHLARDTAPAIESAGLEMERCEHIDFKASPLFPAVPHILGSARRPGEPHAALRAE
jgi:ubiquinone/menaquinone biosynthesis C-methylase UbiE